MSKGGEKDPEEPPDSVRSLNLLLGREAAAPLQVTQTPSYPLLRMNQGMRLGKYSGERAVADILCSLGVVEESTTPRAGI